MSRTTAYLKFRWRFPPQVFTEQIFCSGPTRDFCHPEVGPGTVLGATQSERSRGIADALHARKDEIVWLDGGNSETRGQVAIGNTFVSEELFSSVDPEVNVARCLPCPSHSLPELLGEDSELIPSCAEAVENQEQGLYLNRFMARIVGEYLRRLISGELTVFQTWVNLSSMEMAFVPVNQYHISWLSHLREESQRSSMETVQEVLA